MRPGGMQLTVIPSLARSRERPFAQVCVAAQATSAALLPMGSKIPVMLMIRPHSRDRIPARKTVVRRRAMLNLSSMASSHSASSASGVTGREPPALLTRISSLPNLSWTAPLIASGAATWVRSAAMTSGSSPHSAAISSANVCSRSRRRAVMARRAPSRAMMRAIPTPIPALAPVTRQVFPSSCKFMEASFRWEDSCDRRASGCKSSSAAPTCSATSTTCARFRRCWSRKTAIECRRGAPGSSR